MSRTNIRKHARKRMGQRGYRDLDVDLILEYGTSHSDGMVLTREDADQAISDHRQRISRLEKLGGTTVIQDRDEVTTIYRPCKNRMRRILREGRGRVRRGGGRIAS